MKKFKDFINGLSKAKEDKRVEITNKKIYKSVDSKDFKK